MITVPQQSAVDTSIQNSEVSKVFWSSNRIALLAMILFLITYLCAWISAPEELYKFLDGETFAWYAKILMQWGSPFAVQVINPFQGMGSLFLPYSPWWNPGALVLSLPFDAPIPNLISYAIYWFEAFASTYFLAKSFGWTKLVSIFASQLFIFIMFPPFAQYNSIFGPFLSLAPVLLHLIAIGNLTLGYYIKLGHETMLKNLLIITAIPIGGLIFLVSGGFFAVVYAPVYGLLFLGAILGSDKKTIIWKCSALLIWCLICIVLGIPEYFKNTADYVTRSLLSDSCHTLSLSLPAVWNACSPCYMAEYGINLLSFFCPHRSPISYIYLISFLGGIFGFIGSSKRYRWIYLSYCLVALLPDILNFLHHNSVIQGKLKGVSVHYYNWATRSFTCLFAAYFLFVIGNVIVKVLRRFCSNGSKSFNFDRTSIFDQMHLGKTWPVLFILPASALLFLIMSKPQKTLVAACSEPQPIIERLKDELVLEPGSQFRGAVVSLIGGRGSWIRDEIQKQKNIQLDAPAVLFRVRTRNYLKEHCGNTFMYTDLWKHGIPTIEELWQMITIPMYTVFQSFLSENDFKIPIDRKYKPIYLDTDILQPYSLNARLLSALGTRYVITDKKIVEAALVLVKAQNVPLIEVSANQVSESHELYLYEIKRPNLGNYSPTIPVHTKDLKEAIDLMKHSDFSFEQKVVLHDTVLVSEKSWVTAKNVSLSFQRNGVHVKAESEGTSFLLLPLQYSHCLQLMESGVSKNSDIHLLRANLVQTGILFKNILDLELEFDPGAGFQSECRRKDVEDLKKIGLFSQDY